MREVGPSITEEADHKFSNMMIARPKMSSRGNQKSPSGMIGERANTIESQVSKNISKKGMPKSVSNKYFTQIYSQKLSG